MVKADAIRKFLDDCGLDISYQEAKIKFKKHGKLPESSFYAIRRLMRLEKSKPVAGISELVRVVEEALIDSSLL